LLNELYKIHTFYKFSLDSFIIVVKRAIDIVAERDRQAKKAAAGGDDAEGEEGEGEKPEGEAAEGEEEAQLLEMSPRTLTKRVDDLTESITF